MKKMMMMKRRDFSLALSGLALASTSLALHAQGKPVGEADYVRINPPLPTTPGKIEVIEFFWYGCPHCFAFEPVLGAWVKKLPADVVFRRVPVAFNANFVVHQRLYFALEALGQVEALHGKVFTAMQVERMRLDKDEDVIAFVAKHGVDRAKFTEAFSSFSVNTKAKQASRLAESYKIDGVPTLGIHGRYTTSGTQAGSLERSLVVADALIQKVRKGG